MLFSRLASALAAVCTVLPVAGYSEVLPDYTASPPSISVPAQPSKESIIKLEITADLSGVQKAIANPNVIPNHFDEYGQPEENKYRWQFDTQSGPTVSLNNGRVSIDVTYHGDIETKGFLGGCHLNPVYPRFVISFAPTIQQDNQNWIIGTSNSAFNGSLAPGSDTKCSMFNIPVENKLMQLLNGPNVRDKALSAVKSAKISIPVAEVSKRVAGPFQFAIPSVATKLFVYPGLTSITAAPIEGTLSNATLKLALRGFPTAIIGQSAPPAQVKPVILSNAALPNGPSFSVIAPFSVAYSDITNSLKDGFKNAGPIDAAGQKFNVTDCVAADASGRVLLALTVKGPINGKVYFWGTPQFQGTSVVSVPDLQMAIETKTLLDKIKLGLADLVFGGLQQKLKAACRFDLSKEIRDVVNQMSGDHQISGGTLRLSEINIRPISAISKTTDLTCEVAVEGTALVRLSQHLSADGHLQ
jgi:hypothetical protein